MLSADKIEAESLFALWMRRICRSQFVRLLTGEKKAEGIFMSLSACRLST